MMNKLQLKPRELKIISVIAATHSIGDAAALLGMAQANVSKYLSDFETRVGLKVFERTTRQLALTQFGEALLPTLMPRWIKIANSLILLLIISMKNAEK
jgi:DNA-binding transcriptional LysR family regulator